MAMVHVFILWQASWTDKMNQYPALGMPTQAGKNRWSYLARLGLPAASRKKKKAKTI